jgi:hypothetical protein
MMDKCIKFMAAAGVLISGIGELLRQLNVYESNKKLDSSVGCCGTSNPTTDCCSNPECNKK